MSAGAIIAAPFSPNGIMKPEHYPREPAHLWQHFYEISRIPRPSREEQAVRQYVIDQAERAGHAWRMDDEGNLVVSVAATMTSAAIRSPCRWRTAG